MLITISLAIVSMSSETKMVKVNIIRCACVRPLMLSHCTMSPTIIIFEYDLEYYWGEIVT